MKKNIIFDSTQDECGYVRSGFVVSKGKKYVTIKHISIYSCGDYILKLPINVFIGICKITGSISNALWNIDDYSDDFNVTYY